MIWEIIVLIIWLLIGVGLLQHLDDNTQLRVRGTFKRSLIVLSGLLGVLTLTVMYIVGFIWLVTEGIFRLITKDLQDD